MAVLNGWHRGERAIQARLKYDEPMRDAFTWISDNMPDQHRQFHSTRLPFVPVTTLDAKGRPWASLLAGASGKRGFISSPSDEELVMELKTWPGDPFRDNLQLLHSSSTDSILSAGLGIEFSTRRRNKFAGSIVEYTPTGPDSSVVKFEVNQAIGNCPKYINVRDLIPHPQTTPSVGYNKHELGPGDSLPSELVDLIHSADTVFVASSYSAKDEKSKYPSHVGMNARGGKPGIVRVRQDRRTLVLPDYSGNQLMTSLGNIEATGLAGMTFLDFVTGDILYITGEARNLVGAEAQELMPRQNILTTLRATGFIFVKDALPVRQRTGTEVERSPYSPPIRFLAEESSTNSALSSVYVTLDDIELHSPTIASFKFTTSSPVKIKAGQAAILDFNDLVGQKEYSHMARVGQEASLNDDRMRTWTISSPHPGTAGTKQFTLTIREKEAGLITPQLLSLAQLYAAQQGPGTRAAKLPSLRLPLVGIGGDFTLDVATKNMLWIAGGIGITPFISMLSSLSADKTTSGYDITFALATREPEVLLPLICRAVAGLERLDPARVRVSLHLFTKRSAAHTPLHENIFATIHPGRVSGAFFAQVEGLAGRQAYLCGPPEFEKMVTTALTANGYDAAKIKREGFGY